MEGASAAAKVISLSTAVGQKPVRTKEKSTEILVAKDRGDNLATTKLQTNGVDLIPPQDLSETTHPVEIFVNIKKHSIAFIKLLSDVNVDQKSVLVDP